MKLPKFLRPATYRAPQCQAKIRRPASGRCVNEAIIGVFAWKAGETDVNLNNPVAVFCGTHKPRLSRNVLLRNVRIA